MLSWSLIPIRLGKCQGEGSGERSSGEGTMGGTLPPLPQLQVRRLRGLTKRKDGRAYSCGPRFKILFTSSLRGEAAGQGRRLEQHLGRPTGIEIFGSNSQTSQAFHMRGMVVQELGGLKRIMTYCPQALPHGQPPFKIITGLVGEPHTVNIGLLLVFP